jgi:hypothetical protein
MELPQDVWFQIMYEADYNSMKSLALTNKYTQQLYNDNQFWKMKVEKDYPFAIHYNNNYHTLYKTLDDFFNIQTIAIDPKYFNQIRPILINHIISLLGIVDKPLKEKRMLKIKIADNTLKNIFDIIGKVDRETEIYIKFLIGSLISNYAETFGLKLKLF